MDEEEDELYPLFAPDVPILGHGYEEGVLAYSPACSIERLVDEPSLTIPGRRLFSQLDELRTEVQRRDQELLGMSAKMKTLEEQHQDYQRHIAVLKESLCAKEEHYNLLQADVSPKRLCRAEVRFSRVPGETFSDTKLSNSHEQSLAPRSTLPYAFRMRDQ